MRAVFLADGKVFTTGFSRMSERQLALWDPVSGCGLPEGACAGQTPPWASGVESLGEAWPSQVLSLAPSGTQAARTQPFRPVSPCPCSLASPACLRIRPQQCSWPLKGPPSLSCLFLLWLSLEPQCRGPLLQEASQSFL